MTRSFAPSMQKLIDLALNNRDVFGVLTPAEKKLKEAAKVKVELLARLSKEDKKKKERQHSIPYQQRANRMFAKEMGYTVVGEVSDKDVTGTKFERPNYKTLKEDIKDGEVKADAFIFWAPDRFARDLKEAILEEEDLREGLGIHLKFSDLLYRDIDTSTPIGKLKLQEEFLKAAWEHAKLVHRTTTALDMLKAEGVQLGTFPKHFSKDKEDRVVPIAKAREACRMRVEGSSWGEIRKALGFKTRKEARNVVAYVGRKATEVLREA
ncbi:MAG: recombinase family protein [Thermoplasmata archaeon]